MVLPDIEAEKFKGRKSLPSDADVAVKVKRHSQSWFEKRSAGSSPPATDDH